MSKSSCTRVASRVVSSKQEDSVSPISFTYTERYPRRNSSMEVGIHSQRWGLVMYDVIPRCQLNSS